MVHRAPILNGSALAFLLTDNRKSERLFYEKDAAAGNTFEGHAFEWLKFEI